MEINTHNSGFTGVRVFWVSSILEGVETDETHSLFLEIVGSESDGEKIWISWVPTDTGDILFSLFFVRESPNWEHISFSFSSLKIFSLTPPILIISVTFFLNILDNHSFHDLDTSDERDRVEVGIMFSLFMGIWLRFFLNSRSQFLHVGIKDFPLGDISSKSIRWGWFSGISSLSDNWVNSLSFSSIIIELISHSFLNSLIILSSTWIFLFLLFFLCIDLLFSIRFDFFLDSMFIRIFLDQITFNIQMDNNMMTIYNSLFVFS